MSVRRISGPPRINWNAGNIAPFVEPIRCIRKARPLVKQWYVIHTYSGYENKVKDSLEEMIKSLGKEELFGEVIVPTEKVMELVRGEKRLTSRKFFPGYILVNMELNDETWHIVKSVPKVTGFVGGVRPPSVPEEEIRQITQQIEEGKLKPKPKVHL